MNGRTLWVIFAGIAVSGAGGIGALVAVNYATIGTTTALSWVTIPISAISVARVTFAALMEKDRVKAAREDSAATLRRRIQAVNHSFTEAATLMDERRRHLEAQQATIRAERHRQWTFFTPGVGRPRPGNRHRRRYGSSPPREEESILIDLSSALINEQLTYKLEQSSISFAAFTGWNTSNRGFPASSVSRKAAQCKYSLKYPATSPPLVTVSLQSVPASASASSSVRACRPSPASRRRIP
ncbi:hypothetical protein [Nonomuraea sp. WAC 01424]|uniref:hypothetical protein n=1 Tax=Nonomuraea sp. WAC 01424 TaxID=2203200 RepID=UPI0021ADE4AE|nr:hypothetical protein [Nonomuraea sp. WAC 01424]